MKITGLERRRIRRWVRHLADSGVGDLEMESRALELIFESMLLDRAADFQPHRRPDRLADLHPLIAARLAAKRQNRQKRGLRAAGKAQTAG